MPTKQIVKLTRSKDKKHARISFSFAFDNTDPQAEKIYRGIGLSLREALTPEEATKFLEEFEAQRAQFLAHGG